MEVSGAGKGVIVCPAKEAEPDLQDLPQVGQANWPSALLCRQASLWSCDTALMLYRPCSVLVTAAKTTVFYFGGSLWRLSQPESRNPNPAWPHCRRSNDVEASNILVDLHLLVIGLHLNGTFLVIPPLNALHTSKRSPVHTTCNVISSLLIYLTAWTEASGITIMTHSHTAIGSTLGISIKPPTFWLVDTAAPTGTSDLGVGGPP